MTTLYCNDLAPVNVRIPLGSTLKLEGDEVNFPIHKYDLYAKLDSGVVQVTTRY